MAYNLTDRLSSLSQQNNIEPNIVLTIDGFEEIFSTVRLVEFWTIGSGVLIGDPGLEIGGLNQDPNNLTIISKKGTTREITQQIEIDRGGSGSIQKFNIELVDKDGFLTSLLSPGQVQPDLLGREANVYINLAGGVHPDDSLRIFSGIIDKQDVGPGSWRITVAHPELLKNQDLFIQAQTTITAAIDDTQTAGIFLDDATNFILPQDAVRSLVQIEDELIEFTGITAGELTGVNRGAIGTIADSHDIDTEVVSFYILTGTPLELAQKIMLSNDDNSAYVTGIEVTQFVQVGAATSIPNAILIPDFRLETDQGLVPGALFTITGASLPANNVVNAVLANVFTTDDGTVCILDGVSLATEIASSAILEIKSQYNTLPAGAGCGMNPRQVDMAQHAELELLLGGSFPTYQFYIKDTINAKDFISLEIYFPAGFFQVPRKGRASVVGVLPPLVLSKLARLDETNILNATSLRMKRQINKDFFNTVVYRFNEKALEDKFLAGEIVTSETSFARIPTKTTTLTIDSRGMRDDFVTRQFIQNTTRRYNDRYRFAAESVSIQTNFQEGFNVEVGDAVLVDGSQLSVADIKNATRDFEPRLFTVINKKTGLTTGQMTMELLDTQVGLDGRFGVIGPSSLIDVGSTTSSLKLKFSFGAPLGSIEQEKYEDYIGETLEVHSPDYTFSETVVLASLDPSDNTRINITPALSMVPSEDWIVELGDYPNTNDPLDNNDAKAIHCFWDPTVDIVSGIDNFSFTVDAGDISKFFVGSYIRIHNLDYSIDSTPGQNDENPQVTNVDTGTNTVTVDIDITFTPAAGQKVELIGFPDEGLPYRFF